ATEGGKPTIFCLGSRGRTALKTSVFQSETEFLISARNFAPLSRGSASTIFSCCAALKRYDSPGRRSFIKKKAKSGATTRSRHSTRYSFPEISQSLRWKARLNDPAQNRLLERGHDLVPLRDRLNKP